MYCCDELLREYAAAFCWMERLGERELGLLLDDMFAAEVDRRKSW